MNIASLNRRLPRAKMPEDFDSKVDPEAFYPVPNRASKRRGVRRRPGRFRHLYKAYGERERLLMKINMPEDKPDV